MGRMNYFREALKALNAAKPRNERRVFKEGISQKVGISRPYLDDLVMGRRTGTEDVRVAISKAVGFGNYEDFIQLGEMLVQGKSLSEAQSEIQSHRIHNPSPDGCIEKILDLWPCATEETKIEIRQILRLRIFISSEAGKELEKFKAHSKERFHFLCDSVLADKETQWTFDWLGAELLISYLAEKVNDVDVLEYADDLKKQL